MHERVCQLTRFDWVTLAEVQPFRTREGIDGREMVMNPDGSLEGRFRILAPGEKARLERTYQQQLYTRLNMDDQSLTLLGDDNDSEDVPSDQDDASDRDGRRIPRGRGPRRRRPHRRPINSDNSDDENDYGPDRGGGRIARRRPIPTLEEYNSWHAAMAPTVPNDRNNTTQRISSRFRMEFQEMLQQNSPIAAGVPAPQSGPRPTIRPLRNQKAPPSPEMAPRTRMAPGTGGAATSTPQAKVPRRTVLGFTTPEPDDHTGDGAAHGSAGSVGTSPPPGIVVSVLGEADRERPILSNPTAHLQKVFNEMPQAFVTSVMGTGLLQDDISYYLRVMTFVLLRPAWDAQNDRTAAEAAGRGKKGKGGVPRPDRRRTIEIYVDFFTTGGLNTRAPTPASLLEVLRYSDATIESDDSFFQFLFPIDSVSGYNPPLPPIPPDFSSTVASTQGFAESFMLGVRRVMRFWGFQFRGTSSTRRPLWRLTPDFVAANHGWTRRVDHNHQRIGHVIRSVRLIGANRVARSIYRCLMRAIQNRGFPVREHTRRLWRRAALGPLDMDALASNFPPDADFSTDSDQDGGGAGGGHAGGGQAGGGQGRGGQAGGGQAGGPGPGNLRGGDGGPAGPSGGANPLLVTDPGTPTPGNQPAPPATQQTGNKRPGGFDDNGSHKRQRPQPAKEAPVDLLVNSLGPNWDFLEQLRNTNREDRSAGRDSSGQEDIYTTDNSSSEGFLDPHERDDDFLPKDPSFPVRPHFRKAAVEYVPSVVVPALAPVPVTQPQETQQTVQRYPFLPSFLPLFLQYSPREMILSDKAK